MNVIAVVGPPESGTTALVSRLADRLSDRGRVGTISLRDDTEIDFRDDEGDHQIPAADRTVAIAGDGTWRATGEELGLSDALDRLAVDCEYALVEGTGDDDLTLPRIALGGVDEGDVRLSAPDAEAVDVEDAVATIEQTEPYECLESLVAQAKRSPQSDLSGAIATFTGRVRAKESEDDDRTEYLEFERYDGVAQERMATIREELEAREGVFEVLLHHRTGVVEAEEDIVFVVVLAGHRGEAFETVEDGINRLKDEVPLFKKEVTVSGEFWAHQHEV
jgi:molybdopterin synthase catalytic subunit